MMRHTKFFLSVFLVALLMALLEVQIEGANGWAANLPTWKFYPKFSFLGMWGGGEKPLTGYHIYLWLFSFSLTHTAFIFNKWSWKKELKILSFYVFITTFEGILWFVVNPAWGIGKFNQEINWYKELWILGLPAEYYLRFGLGLMLYYLAIKNENTKSKSDKLQKL